ncbi:carbohydrate transporter/ sugar porter/ transporter isoform 1 [Zea mays]|uniref:Major facilitator superfamily protein n=3 Tax=Zea mays TaxID=4577 RepID=C0PHD3_MAIZE|nr:carbohydrate transporter/ sugar porter/ transporter isoform 1 [Zea mays]ACN34599.1 unknown [Zea mays]ONM04789.1 Major facilitator superfamily protein [Zea mays]
MRDAEAASRRRWTLVLVNMASVLEKADEVLLPAVYKEVGTALGASPTALGSLTLCRALVQAACYPLAAYASARHDRARVVAVGAFLWAAATFLVAVSGSFLQMAISRGLNGIGLALVLPAISSLVADYTDDHTRGAAFGWLQMTCNLGSILGGSFGVLLAPVTFLGVAGWRLAFHSVAVISVALGVLMWLFAADPSPAAKCKTAASAGEEAKELLQHARRVLGVTTFQIIVAQGIAGSIPWSALNFSAMWLELVGFTNWQTSVITGLYLFATALGALFGGLVGDPVARRFPNTGRIALAQISSASALPLGAILLLALPNDPSTGVAHAVTFFVMGFAISWNASSTNNPIFAEIVPEKARTTVYALDKCFEAVFASFASPIVGVLAERVFGYKPVSSDTSVDTDRENAAALAKAVYTEIAVPMAICCLTYTFLYYTYPRDRERARKDLLMASDDHLGGEANDNESSAVHTLVDEESSVSSLNQRLIS